MKLLHLIGSICFCAVVFGGARDSSAATAIVVSIADQKLALIENGTPLAQFPISTSKFGVGDRPGSYATPLGLLEVASKIGANAPLGTVFKSRIRTGEILRPNARGRDPIVTRIIWLRGLEKCNARAYDRAIYIHGTPVERMIGRPASYGCIRMRSRDVASLFALVNVGTKIAIMNCRLQDAITRVPGDSPATGLRVAAN
jgi:L,D-transpeptidase catalytic domain